MPKITMFADPMCSWCYGFSPVMQKLRLVLAQNFELQLVMGGLRAAKHPMSEQQRHEIQSHWLKVQAATDRAFDFQHCLPDGFIYNTLPACRAVAVLFCVEPTLAWNYLDALHTAFYERGLDITDDGNLVDVATNLGLPEKSFAAAIQDPAADDALQADLQLTVDNGVTGFPSLLIELAGKNGKPDYKRLLVVGYEPYESVVEKITLAIQRHNAA